MTKRKIILFSLPIVILVVILAIIYKPWVKSSSEMIYLRQVEQKLSLPIPKDRIEEDIGEHFDSKGARHNTRYILNYYDDSKKVSSVTDRLNNSGWIEVENDSINGEEIKWFINHDLKACISTSIDSKSSDSLPHNIFIFNKNSDGCKSYLNQPSSIGSFEECKAAGNPIMESFPEQCISDGRSFTNTTQSVE